MSDILDNNNKPEFKPGDTPHYVFGKEVLNGQVNWQQTLIEVLQHSKYTISRLAETLEVDESVLQNLLKTNQTKGLYFRAGARLLSIHYKVVPGSRDE